MAVLWNNASKPCGGKILLQGLECNIKKTQMKAYITQEAQLSPRDRANCDASVTEYFAKSLKIVQCL